MILVRDSLATAACAGGSDDAASTGQESACESMTTPADGMD